MDVLGGRVEGRTCVELSTGIVDDEILCLGGIGVVVLR